jgi:ribonuclease D
VTALAEARNLPVENLLSPDALRRLSWDPPRPADPDTVALALAGYGARPWQIELTAAPVAEALTAPAQGVGGDVVGDADGGDVGGDADGVDR